MANNYQEAIKKAEEGISGLHGKLEQLHKLTLANIKEIGSLMKTSGSSPKELNTQLTKTNTLLTESEKLAKRRKVLEEQVAAATSKDGIAVAQLTKELAGLNSESKDQVKTAKETRKYLEETAKAREKEAQAALKSANATKDASRAYNKLVKDLNISKKTLQDINLKYGVNSKEALKAAKAHDILAQEVKKANTTLVQLTAAEKKETAATNESIKAKLKQADVIYSNKQALDKQRQAALKQATSNKGLTATFKNLFRSMVAFIGVRMFFQFIKDTFELTKKLDSLKFAMLAITKSQEESSNATEFLRRITKAYGAEIVSTTERYIRFLAAAKQSNVALKDTNQIFETFTKVSGVLGMNTTDLTGIFLALEQMLSKGKVTTEELRRQLGERLPGAMGIMATALGVTIPKLDEMLKKGEVLSAEVLPEFARQVELSFGINSVTKVNTLAAAWARLKNKWVEIFSEFSKSNNIAKTLSKGIDLLSENFVDIVKNVFFAIKAFVAYKVLLGVVAARKMLLAKRTALLAAQQVALAANINMTTVAWTRLKVVMKASWVGILITVLAGLVWVVDRFTISLEKSTKALIKQNEEFLETSRKGAEVAESNNKMADSYDRLTDKVGKNNKEQSSLTNSISKNEEEQRKLNEQIEKGGDKTGYLAEQVRLLHNENIDLTDKTILFKDEQAELDRITKALGTTFSGAITNRNDYGDATEINTTKVRELTIALREQHLLEAGVNDGNLEEKIIKLKEEQSRLDNVIIAQKSILGKGGSEKVIKNMELAFLKTTKLSNANKTLIVQAEKQLKYNKELIFSYSAEGIAAKTKEDKEIADDLRKKKSREEEDLAIRNRINLGNEIAALEKKKDVLSKDENKFRLANDKLSEDSSRKEMDRIDAEILKRQKLLDFINNKETGGSKSKDKDTTLDLLQIGAKLNKDLLDNSTTSYNDRLKLLEDYGVRLNLINTRIFENDMDEAKKSTTERAELEILALANYRERIEENGAEELSLRKKINKDKETDLKKLFDDEVDGIEELEKVSDRHRRRELAAVAVNSDMTTKEVEERNKEIKRINDKFDKAQAEVQLKALNKILENSKFLSEAQTTIIKDMINTIQIALNNFTSDTTTDDKLKERFEKYKDIFSSVTDTFFNMFDIDVSKFDFIFDKIRDSSKDLFDKDSLGEWAELSKELIGGVLNASLQRYDIELQEAQIYRDKILDDENASAEQKEAAKKKFDEEERRIKTEKAKQERQNALISIAMDTAVGVAKVIAQTGVFSPALSIPIILLGAIQAAMVAAQPLPKFEMGTDNAPRGWAMTDERGSEMITDKYGNIKDLGSDKGSRYQYLEQGDKVFTASKTKELLNSESIQNAVFEMNMMGNGEILSEKNVDKSLLNEVGGLRSDIDIMGKRIEKMASRKINVNNKVEIIQDKAY